MSESDTERLELKWFENVPSSSGSLDDPITTVEDTYANRNNSPHFGAKEPHSTPSHLEDYRTIIDSVHKIPNDTNIVLFSIGAAIDDSERNLHYGQQLPLFIIQAAEAKLKCYVLNYDILEFDTNLEMLLKEEYQKSQQEIFELKNYISFKTIKSRFPLRPHDEGTCNLECAFLVIRTIQKFIENHPEMIIILFNSVSGVLYPAFLKIITPPTPNVFYICKPYDIQALIAKKKSYENQKTVFENVKELFPDHEELIDMNLLIERKKLNKITLEWLTGNEKIIKELKDK